MKKRSMWSLKIMMLSVCLSLTLSMLTQTFFSHLGVIFSIFIIAIFIAMSVLFDMIGVAVSSLTEKNMPRVNMCFDSAVDLIYQSRDKINSLCCDVVGDICGILSGAGGVNLVRILSLNKESTFLLVSCLVSSLIAGLTIFAKAIFKNIAIKNHQKIIINLAHFICKDIRKK